MKPYITYTVAPRFPENVTKLRELTLNFWWTWSASAKALFESINPELWQRTHHNPVALLRSMPQEELQRLAANPDFCTKLEAVYDEFTTYMTVEKAPGPTDGLMGTIAYFCAEFGLAECFQNYSGGLGVLAGDHLKTASDLALPLVGVGLLYQQGYFHQYLSENGWQSERYADVDFSQLPLELMSDQEGRPVTVSVELPDGPAHAQIWRARVGRISLLLLDTNIDLNERSPNHRDITDQLYGGTTETRIMQEMLLGIGGMRALRAMGYSPTVLHINEGHAAFCALERTRMMQEELGLSFSEALEITRAGGCFTTHTPVPAGNEIFTTGLIKQYFSKYHPTLGLTEQEFMELGRLPDGTDDDGFSMTVLGLKTTTYRNGVSELHGAVAREMWHYLWPQYSRNEVPIRGITNGVHALTWVAKEFASLYAAYLGERWYEHLWDDAMWARVREIPDATLWSTHEQRRRILVDRVREHVRSKALLHMSPHEKASAFDLLHPHTLTIGFARRFATYKRSDLLFRNMERLVRLVKNEKRPVQILIAGKAHPRDVAGKEMMHRIIMALKNHGIERQVVFLEDYDMDIAKYLVKGVDVWLNTPRRPYEASGTSGMKAALNGVLHCSVPDGWWAEAFDGTNGFTIGRGEEYTNDDEQDMVESEILYRLLESTIVPAFYERNDTGVPIRWVELMKNSIATNAGRFSSARMVRDYTQHFYVPASTLASTMMSENGANARALRAWKTRMDQQWRSVRVHNVTLEDMAYVHVGKSMRVHATVDHAGIAPSDMRVELCHGVVDARGHMTSPSYHAMQAHERPSGTESVYTGEYECSDSGMQGVNVRAMPYHPLVPFPQDLSLMSSAHEME